jgi:CRISPR-associated protein Csd1
MILDRLRDLRDRLDDRIIPSYHKRQKPKWVLDVAADGRFRGLVDTNVKLDAPYMRRAGSKPPPYLLVDKTEYVVGLPRKDTDKARARAAWRHDAYVDLVRQCAEATGEEEVRAYLAFLEHHVEAARAEAKEQEVKPGDLIAPQVDGRWLTELPAVRAFWQNRRDTVAAEKSAIVSECLICGQERPIARTHPVELKLGPNRVGLVTGNASAFLSHGLQQSEIAPICQRCARQYGEALRFLLEDDDHHLRVGDATWLFWTREPDEDAFDIAHLLQTADETEVKRLLKSTFGHAVADVEPNRFYALVVSANTSRLVVRSWLTLALPEAKRRLAGYFRRQRLVVHWREGDAVRREAKTHGLFALAASTVRDARKDLPPQVLPALVEHALTGRPLPKALMHRAVQRARADKDHVVTHPRAARRGA